ncbi:MAG: hypothetical protein JXR39_12030 [Marinilabiliaceae bacterium]|nr:hypothetical protein [Marinilabiliaceae bacterium]
MAVSLGINDIKELTSLMHDKLGYPFHELSTSFMKRRLSLFFDKLFIKTKERFIEQLDNELFLKSVLYNIPVETTELFRDPGFWRVLNNKFLSSNLLAPDSVWFPDVSSGEELYSFQILNKGINHNNETTIYYNHPSNARLDEIKTGIINNKNIETHDNNFKRLELESEFSDFCHIHNGSTLINEILLEHLVPCKGWFLNTPNEPVSMIIFRNTMLYLSKPLQEKVAQVVYETLKPGGILTIGIKEPLPENIIDKMEIVDEQERIFKKPGSLV